MTKFCLHSVEQPPVLVVPFVLRDQNVQLIDEFALDLSEVSAGSLLAFHHIKENVQSRFPQFDFRNKCYFQERPYHRRNKM